MTRTALSAHVVLAAVGMAVVVGCSSPATRPAPPPPATILASVPDCDATPMTEAGAVPAGFEPVSVVVCQPVVSLRAPDPGPPPALGSPADPSSLSPSPTAVPSVPVPPAPRTLTGDLGPLMAALARPSDPVPADVICPAMAQVPPLVFLVDATGRAMRPAWPRTACGFVQQAARDALGALTEMQAPA